MKRGSALVSVIWTLAVLSILIASYAMDAHLQTRINLYLRERVHVDHLTDAGIAIAEVILLDYQNVTVPTEGGNETTTESDIEEKLEDDRWYLEKVALKDNRECDTGAIPVDALDRENGTVTVKIKPIESKWNINRLYAGGDANYDKIWEAILVASGIPQDEEELIESIVASWCDWRDPDESTTGEYGAETEFYSQAYEDYQRNLDRPDSKEAQMYKNYRAKCRNGEITDLDELKCLRGFNEFDDNPISADALLDGGILNPDEKEENQIRVKGIRRYFSIFGSGKVNVNIADADTLATVPGIFQSDGNRDDEAVTNAADLAEAIVQCRQMGEGEVVRDKSASASDATGSYSDWNDLQTRVQEAVNTGSGEYLQQEAEQYLSYAPDKYFEVTITGTAMGISHSIKATVLVQDSKVRYIRWQEDP
ncbi:MAG: general secretion pathway protein GspK [Kiritimatiellae bacterium]|nr:general secretion pathway protein GspK [Kiritimatiellia bacterium]